MEYFVIRVELYWQKVDRKNASEATMQIEHSGSKLG